MGLGAHDERGGGGGEGDGRGVYGDGGAAGVEGLGAEDVDESGDGGGG